MEKNLKKDPVMIDVSSKPILLREAIAMGCIHLKNETMLRIQERRIEKGDPISTAKVAAIQAAKNTSNIIPLCHPIPITNVEIDEEITQGIVRIKVTVKATSKTGVEMEALTATSIALLTIWDMVKQYEKDVMGQYPSTVINEIRVLKKSKATSGNE